MGLVGGAKDMADLSTKLPWEQAAPRWASQLNPIIKNPLVTGQQINNILLLASIPTTIYHSLGQAPQGWIVVDNMVNAYIIRTQPFNAKSITLQSSADTTISIWIY